MKKLLSLLSVLTISGSAVPTTIAASSYQKEETIKNSDINYQQTNNLKDLSSRTKREIKTDIEFNCSGDNFFTKRRINGTFNPNTWEKIIRAYGNINKTTALSSPSSSSEPIKTVIFNSSIDNKCSGEFYPQLSMAEFILINWNNIDNVWKESNRQRKIKISIAGNVFGHDYYLESVDIINDGAIYENDYLNNFNEDFSNTRVTRDIILKQKRSINNSDNTFNLGIIENDSDINILNKVKSLYPKVDISHFEIIEKSEYSYVNQNFSAKLVVKNNSNRYPVGMQKKIIFNTKTKLNEIKNEILNNNLVKQWIKHINEWKSNLNKLDIDRLKKDNSWLITQKEIAKSYIRDWNIILDLIKNNFKIEELNKTVKGIKGDIDSLRNRMNEIENRIENLENSQSNSGIAWCQNVGWGVSVVSGASEFTGIGEVISIIAGSVAVLCGVIDTLSS